MLCVTGSLSQISYHLKLLGRVRWRPRKGSKWVYQCFFTPSGLPDTKERVLKIWGGPKSVKAPYRPQNADVTKFLNILRGSYSFSLQRREKMCFFQKIKKKVYVPVEWDLGVSGTISFEKLWWNGAKQILKLYPFPVLLNHKLYSSSLHANSVSALIKKGLQVTVLLGCLQHWMKTVLSTLLRWYGETMFNSHSYRRVHFRIYLPQSIPES